jgi:hypothetical protein
VPKGLSAFKVIPMAICGCASIPGQTSTPPAPFASQVESTVFSLCGELLRKPANISAADYLASRGIEFRPSKDTEILLLESNDGNQIGLISGPAYGVDSKDREHNEDACTVFFGGSGHDEAIAHLHQLLADKGFSRVRRNSSVSEQYERESASGLDMLAILDSNDAFGSHLPLRDDAPTAAVILNF